MTQTILRPLSGNIAKRPSPNLYSGLARNTKSYIHLSMSSRMNWKLTSTLDLNLLYEEDECETFTVETLLFLVQTPVQARAESG
ncbi:hypothetical protein NST20_05395 [Weizmannia sp. FSL W8-0676]|uniref:hypothetical protein n=1 Tax=Weizmannia sp. FSL W8-0676 TaxID=2954703 RepID=UPI0031584DAE